MAETYARLSRKRLAAISAQALRHAPHLAPIIEAVRDFGVTLVVVPQSAEPTSEQRKPAARPFIAIVTDDTDRAIGPRGFDRASLGRLIRIADCAAVVACAADVAVYQALSELAAHLTRNVLIIETRPEQEIAWIDLVRSKRPDLPMLVCTVEGTRQ